VAESETTNEPTPTVNLKEIGIEFSNQWIFRNLNLIVNPQESVVIVGPSGSGKSVLLKMIAGLINPSEGIISVIAKNKSMLFQKNALFDSFTALENLLFPMKERLGIEGLIAKTKAMDLLESVGLAHAADLFPDEISGGMQKRLGIARALAVNPDLLIYDDPTAGLDPITSRTIADLILEVRKHSNGTMIAVTNDMNRAYQLGDQIYLLAQGKLIRGGTAEETRNNSDPFIKQFIHGHTQGPLTSPEDKK